jgi:hypothetical protein
MSFLKKSVANAYIFYLTSNVKHQLIINQNILRHHEVDSERILKMSSHSLIVRQKLPSLIQGYV